MEVWKIIILSFHGWFAGSMLILQGVIFDTSTFTNGKASYLIESRPWSCSGGSWVCQCWRAFVACSPCWLRKSASPSTLLKAARCVWGNGHKIHAGFNRCCSQMIQQCLLHWVVVYCWYCMILFNFTYDMIWYDMIWYDMVRYGTIWYDMVRYDMYILCTCLGIQLVFFERLCLWCRVIKFHQGQHHQLEEVPPWLNATSCFSSHTYLTWFIKSFGSYCKSPPTYPALMLISITLWSSTSEERNPQIKLKTQLVTAGFWNQLTLSYADVD